MGWKQKLKHQLDADRFIEDQTLCQKLSKDYFWYSPILKEKLEGRYADGVVIAKSYEDIETVLQLAYDEQIPVTVRGAGTGNYGQAVPLSGGIVLDMSKLNEVVELGKGYAIVQAGVRLASLEKLARLQVQELRIYPSTYVTATVGGFVCGGSGGIGSITWGNLWDDNVLEAKVFTLEQQPKLLTVSGEELAQYIHSYGTTGILIEIKLALAPMQQWEQCIVQFATMAAAMKFSEQLSLDPTVMKRLVSVMEAPITSFISPLKKILDESKAFVIIEVSTDSMSQLNALILAHDGELKHHIEALYYRKTTSLSDYTWNHTTLWALRKDATYTYLQADFSKDCYAEQITAIKQQFNDEVLIHVEWITVAGELVPTSLPLVKFTTEQRLYEIIAFFEANNIIIYDPHTWLLDAGGRGALERISSVKRKNDPLSLLNPGKLSLEESR